jgi:hypothetical protein
MNDFNDPGYLLKRKKVKKSVELESFRGFKKLIFV